MPEPSSCINKKPFIELGTENVPKLDYKLPQTNGFIVNLPLRIDIPSADFKQEFGIGLPPINNY